MRAVKIYKIVVSVAVLRLLEFLLNQRNVEHKEKGWRICDNLWNNVLDRGAHPVKGKAFDHRQDMQAAIQCLIPLQHVIHERTCKPFYNFCKAITSEFYVAC